MFMVWVPKGFWGMCFVAEYWYLIFTQRWKEHTCDTDVHDGDDDPPAPPVQDHQGFDPVSDSPTTNIKFVTAELPERWIAASLTYQS